MIKKYMFFSSQPWILPVITGITSIFSLITIINPSHDHFCLHIEPVLFDLKFKRRLSIFIFYTMLGEICIEKDMKAEFWIFLSVLQKYCSIFSESPSILSCQNHSDFFCTTKKRSDSSWNAFLKPAAQILYILIQHVGRQKWWLE